MPGCRFFLALLLIAPLALAEPAVKNTAIFKKALDESEFQKEFTKLAQKLLSAKGIGALAYTQMTVWVSAAAQTCDDYKSSLLKQGKPQDETLVEYKLCLVKAEEFLNSQPEPTAFSICEIYKENEPKDKCVRKLVDITKKFNQLVGNYQIDARQSNSGMPTVRNAVEQKYIAEFGNLAQSIIGQP